MSAENHPTTPSEGAPAPKEHHALSAEDKSAIDAAMAALHAPGAPAAPAAKPGFRGPRVVQAGREHRTGTVVSVGPTDLFLEFGPKELGVLPRAQFPEDQVPAKGDQVEAVIDRYEASDNIYICSRPGAVQKAQWELLEPGQVIEARVTGVVQNKAGAAAGLELEVAGHNAFMPASQISHEHIKDLSVFVGEKLSAQVVRVDRSGKGNIILSRRDVIERERQEQAEKLKASLQEGQTLEGTVKRIAPFGAFVDVGGVDGLVHISDLTYDRAGFGETFVRKYVQEGQRLNVRILKLDWENHRLSLGVKQVQGDPFATAVNAIAEGAEVTGRVTSTTEFGAFIEIAPGVQGLAHISELDHRRIARVEDAVKKDEVVRAKVLKIDPGSRRISLSLKALKPLPDVQIGAGSGHAPRGRRGEPGRSADEILKETPALRRLREKFKGSQFKGGLG
ncbi:MAG: S1 RNA-binding domain-containing protein [Phycisphaerae bacterium]|nr:S1 RNA-binding domain-containing protein [Phycisphaerae bacterium]